MSKPSSQAGSKLMRPVVLAAALLSAPSGEAAAQPRLTLEFRDAGTGQLTDARVRGHGPGGHLFSAMDPVLLSHSSWRTGYYVHASHSLELDGPEGSYFVAVTRGITSVTQYRQFTVSEPDSAIIFVEDWIDPRLDGWYGADTHAHLAHDLGLHYAPLTLEQGAVAARAEGLDLMYLLENDPGSPGGPVIPPQPGTTLVWGEEYRNSFWGHVVMLGLDDLVMWNGPGCCGTLLPAWPTLTWTLEQGAGSLRVLAHPRSTDTPLGDVSGWPGSGHARERAALALGAGLLDGFAVASASNQSEPWAIDDYLAALRMQARWAAVGEGDRALDRFQVTPPGQPRTYARVGTGWFVGDPDLPAAWEAAVRQRRCFATTGPIIREFSVGSAEMGGEFDAGSPGTVSVHFAVAAYTDLTRLTLHGATGEHWDYSPPPGQTELDTTLNLAVSHDEFMVLEAVADHSTWYELEFTPRALSSPIWVEAGAPWPVDGALARTESDALEAYFQQAGEVRGFGSPADSVAAWVDIVGAAAQYESMFDDPPAAFSLLAPDDGATLPGASTNLQWSASVSHDGEPVSYRVVIARDPGFADVVVDVGTSDTTLPFEGADPESYHWKVEALEPGESPTVASDAPRRFFLSGGTVAAPVARAGSPLAVMAYELAPGGLRLSLRLARPLPVRLRWIDLRGRVVGQEDLGRLDPGVSSRFVGARDHHGNELARGVYWLAVESGAYRDLARVVWLR